MWSKISPGVTATRFHLSRLSNSSSQLYSRQDLEIYESGIERLAYQKVAQVDRVVRIVDQFQGIQRMWLLDLAGKKEAGGGQHLQLALVNGVAVQEAIEVADSQGEHFAITTFFVGNLKPKV